MTLVQPAEAAGTTGRRAHLPALDGQRVRDGEADRSADGVHTYPQGAARFTAWLLTELAKLFPGFTPPAREAWANTGWSADRNFKGC